MKVIATAYLKERLVIDEVDALTASMTAQVLNDMRAHQFLEKGAKGSWWFYSAQDDAYQVKHGA